MLRKTSHLNQLEVITLILTALPKIFRKAIHHFFSISPRKKENELAFRINDNFQILNPTSLI